MVTVKEAIKRLRRMADGGTNFSKESNEACRMGAEALKEIEKRGAVNCGQLCEWNTTAGCGKPNGVPCKMSNVTVAKNETVADVAPVVRCKDCKYHSIIPHTDLYLCRKSYTGCRAEFFCADGERKGDDGSN